MENKRRKRRQGVAALSESGVETTVQTALEQFAAELGQHGLAATLGHMLGLMVPQLGHGYLVYRIIRVQDNIRELQEQIGKIAALVDPKIHNHRSDSEWIQEATKILITTLDVVAEEREKEKIQYFAEGFGSAFSADKLNVERYKYYTELLAQCSVYDLDILRNAVPIGFVGPATNPENAEVHMLAVHKLLRLNLLIQDQTPLLRYLENANAQERHYDGIPDGALKKTKRITDFNIASNQAAIPRVTMLGRHFFTYFVSQSLDDLHVTHEDTSQTENLSQPE